MLIDDRLAIVRVDNAVNGTARLLADGAIAFMPDAGFIGQGRMRYLVEDQDGETDDAHIFVDVGADNGAPLARNDNVEVNEDTVLVLAANDLLANDDDPDGDPIEIIEVKDGVNGLASWSANGSVLRSGSKFFRFRTIYLCDQ